VVGGVGEWRSGVYGRDVLMEKGWGGGYVRDAWRVGCVFGGGWGGWGVVVVWGEVGGGVGWWVVFVGGVCGWCGVGGGGWGVGGGWGGCVGGGVGGGWGVWVWRGGWWGVGGEQDGITRPKRNYGQMGGNTQCPGNQQNHATNGTASEQQRQWHQSHSNNPSQ